jgi:hypothetical protein
MANNTYTVNADGRVAAGKFLRSAIQRIVDDMPSNSWKKINNNNVNDVWTPLELRSPYGVSGKSPMDAIIKAWSSSAWDKNRSRLILWGGGHANTSANDVYTFDANTGLWSLAFYPSDYYEVPGSKHSPICGGWRQPCSAHTYDNQVYAPIIDRFLTFGGAQHGDGGKWLLYDGDSSTVQLRAALCYSLDLTLAGQGYVAGATGDNPPYSGADLPGANAWTVRDWLGLPTPPVINETSTNCGTAYVEEDGKDVIYKTMASSTVKQLWRIELNQNWQQDVITKVGRNWNGSIGEGCSTVDPVNRFYIMSSNSQVNPFVMWDLKTAGPANNDQHIKTADITGDIAEYLAVEKRESVGLDYNPVDGKIYCWIQGTELYRLTPPSGNPTPTTGWHMEKITQVGSEFPLNRTELSAAGASDTGVNGKWEYAPELGAFVGLQHAINGDVWVYKP